MNGSRQDRLYNLLPALYRQLDERQGQPLRALMAVLEREYARLEEDMGAVYDNWFIQTCDRWVKNESRCRSFFMTTLCASLVAGFLPSRMMTQ